MAIQDDRFLGPASDICCLESSLIELEGANASMSDCIRERPSAPTGVHVRSGPPDSALPNTIQSRLPCDLADKRSKDHADAEQGDYESPRVRASCTSVVPTSIGITASQRAIVVDNMITVAGSLRLSDTVLFLAVACLDRYLSTIPTSLELLQPLSITCLWVAAKYDSAVAPRAAVFASMLVDPYGNSLSCAAVATELLVTLEASLLQTLDYRLASIDTTKCHLQEIMHQLQACTDMAGSPNCHVQQQQLCCMMSYLAEVSLLEYQLLPFPPGQLAAASFALAHVLLGRHLDMNLMVTVTGYTFPQLHNTLQYLCALHTTLIQALHNGKPYAVSVKYMSPAVHAVACVVPLCDPQDPRIAL